MKVFDNPQELAPFALVALIFGVIRILVMPGERGWKTFVVTLIVCIPVGILAGAICLELFEKEYIALGVCAGASLIAEKFILALLAADISGWIKRVSDNLIEKFTK